MKILALGDPHGDMKNLGKIPKKDVDLILCVGDAGKADLARERFFENVKRKKEGLSELDDDSKFQKNVFMEIYSSSLNVWRYLSRIAPCYSILGNVGGDMVYDSEVKKSEKKYGIKLPSLRNEMNKIKNFHFVRNVVRNIGGIRIGFLEYFIDSCWIKEYGIKDKKKIRNARNKTAKAKKVLRNFGNLDVLICHQPPYGYLDKTNHPSAPKSWKGRHAGSKVILDYVRKYQPKYVFCGHVHEAEGKAKIGKTNLYNLGVAKYKIIELKNKKLKK